MKIEFSYLRLLGTPAEADEEDNTCGNGWLLQEQSQRGGACPPKTLRFSPVSFKKRICFSLCMALLPSPIPQTTGLDPSLHLCALFVQCYTRNKGIHAASRLIDSHVSKKNKLSTRKISLTMTKANWVVHFFVL